MEELFLEAQPRRRRSEEGTKIGLGSFFVAVFIGLLILVVIFSILGGTGVLYEQASPPSCVPSCASPPEAPMYISGNPYNKKPCHHIAYTDQDPDNYYSVLVNGQQAYPCDGCYSRWDAYGGVKAGVTPKDVCAGDAVAEGAGMNQCEIVDTENRLNRTSKIFTRCRGLSTFDVLM